MLNIAIIVVVTLAAATQAKQARQAHDGGPFVTHNRIEPVPMAAPYRQLFLVPGKRQSPAVQVEVQEDAVRAAMKERLLPTPGSVVEKGPCGMPIIAARPEVDPKMIVTIPESASKTSKIRAIEPPQPCGRR